MGRYAAVPRPSPRRSAPAQPCSFSELAAPLAGGECRRSWRSWGTEHAVSLPTPSLSPPVLGSRLPTHLSGNGCAHARAHTRVHASTHMHTRARAHTPAHLVTHAQSRTGSCLESRKKLGGRSLGARGPPSGLGVPSLSLTSNDGKATSTLWGAEGPGLREHPAHVGGPQPQAASARGRLSRPWSPSCASGGDPSLESTGLSTFHLP